MYVHRRHRKLSLACFVLSVACPEPVLNQEITNNLGSRQVDEPLNNSNVDALHRCASPIRGGVVT